MNKTRVRLATLLLAVSFALSGCSLVKNIGGSSGAGTKTITAGDITLYDNCLHGWAKVLDVIQNAWNATLNWFIENL